MQRYRNSHNSKILLWGISSGFTHYKMLGLRWKEEEIYWNREQDLGHDTYKEREISSHRQWEVTEKLWAEE